MKKKHQFLCTINTSLTLTFLNGFDGISNTYLIKLKQLIITVSKMYHKWLRAKHSTVFFFRLFVCVCLCAWSANDISSFNHNFCMEFMWSYVLSKIKHWTTKNDENQVGKNEIVKRETLRWLGRKKIKLYLNVIK